MKFNRILFSLLIGMALLLAACGPDTDDGPTPMSATNTPLPGSTTVVAGTLIRTSQNDILGSFLVDGDGRTLYINTEDTNGVSSCDDNCIVDWPPVTTVGQPQAGGVNTSMLGTITRDNGDTQVAYNGWPLYYSTKDMAAGDTNGQGQDDHWFVISPLGEKIEFGEGVTETPMVTSTIGAEATLPHGTPGTPSALLTGTPLPPGGAAVVKLVGSDTTDQFLVDENGMTLYLFTKDSPDTSTCYDDCAKSWPPLLTTNVPVAGDGVDAAKLGTITRDDGSLQVTYNGWPLYYYAKDTVPGDTLGQGVGSVWYLVSATGEQITTGP